MGRAVVLPGLVVVWSSFACPTSRVTGLLTFAEVALFVGWTVVVLVSAMASLGRVASTFSLDKSTFGVVTSWRAAVFSVPSSATPTSGIAGLLSGDQDIRLAPGDRLRKREGERRHQGEKEELRMHDGRWVIIRNAMQETKIY